MGTPGKAIATTGFWIMLVAGLGGIVLTGVLLAADQLRTAYGVDIIQAATLGLAITSAAFFIGKGIRDYGLAIAAGGIPTFPATTTPGGSPGDGGGADGGGTVPPPPPGG